MTRKFDFDSLELFVAVCESRSITQAAERQSITASAVSKRITRLEEFAGVLLLVRTSSGVTPTNEGVRLLEHARSVLYNLDILERDVRSLATSRRGGLTILANRSANASFVSEKIVSFLSDPNYRNIDVHIGEATSHEVVSGVKAGAATLGVCWAETDMAGVDWKPSRRDQLAAVVPRNHPLAESERITFADTVRYDQVGIHSGGPVTHQLRRQSVHSGKLLRYRVVAPTFDVMVRVVESGIAIAIMPTTVASRYAREARIVVVPLTEDWCERQFAVCCRSRRALSRPAAALFDHLALEVEKPTSETRVNT